MDINLNSFDPRMVKVFQAAIRFTSHMKHEFIGSEHLLWALSQDPGAAGQALRKNGLQPNLIEEYLHQYDFSAAAGGNFRAIQMSGEAEQLLRLAESSAKAAGHEKLDRRIFSEASWMPENALHHSSFCLWKQPPKRSERIWKKCGKPDFTGFRRRSLRPAAKNRLPLTRRKKRKSRRIFWKNTEWI